jgi:paraquat-inducible protein A
MILFIVSLLFPIIEISVLGSRESFTIPSMVFMLLQNKYYIVGFMLLFLLIIIPFLSISLYILISIFIKFKIFPNVTKQLLILLSNIKDWNMIDIFLISILVALVKLLGYFELNLGISFYALIFFVIFDLYLNKSIKIYNLWKKYQNNFNIKIEKKDFLENQLVRCHKCEAVNIDTDKEIDCRRCYQRIYHSKTKSINFTLAYLVTAMISFIPANFYPMLITDKFGNQTESTIIGGAIEMWEEGSYPIALIIVFASIVIPIIKFILILFLIISSNLEINKVDKQKIYYITETIGPLSMIDVFVVSILSSLVHLSTLQIIAGPAASAFAIMVFFTLLSALSFDTRLIKHTPFDTKSS